MHSLQIRNENVPEVGKETMANHGKLSIKAAKKVRQHEKPPLYKKAQDILSTVKTSLAEDVIEARND